MVEQNFEEEAVKEYGTVGQSKSNRFRNLNDEEYLSELRWPKNIKVYNKMRRSDSQVQAMLLVMELPIRSTKWIITPASDDEKDIEVANFIEKNLFSGPPKGLTQHFDDFLRLALTMLPFGHSVFEIVFEVEDGMYKWKKFAHRPQYSIYDFMYDEEGGPEGVKQIKYGTTSREVVEIPIEKLIIFANRMESGNLRGNSILRSAYKHWKIKDFMYEILNIGFERNLVGTPTMDLPENYDDNDKAKAREIVESLRSGESAGVVIPPGFILDIFEGKRGMMEVMPYIEHHDQKMVASILAQFLSLGTGSTGSWALSKDQSDLFLMSLNSTAKYIKQTFNSYAIPQLVELNWDVDDYPQLDYNPISEDQALLDTVHKMITGEVIAPDENIEGWVRDMLELPEKPEDNQVEASEERSRGKNIDLELKEEEGKHNHHSHSEGECSCATTLAERYDNRTFQDGERTWRRELTVYEKQVDLEEIEDKFDTVEELFMQRGKAITEKQINDLYERIKNAIKEGNLQDIAKIPVRYKGEFTDFLREQQKELIDFGVEQATEELEIDKEKIAIPNSKRRAVNAKAGVVADNVAQRIKTSMTLEILGRLESGQTEKSALFNARQLAVERAERELQGSGSATVSEAINAGRNIVEEQSDVRLAQFSAILDDKVCDLCRRLDGMIIRTDNPDFDRFSPPIHRNCRCLWVYIRPDEEPQPEPDWESPPSSLVDRYGELI